MSSELGWPYEFPAPTLIKESSGLTSEIKLESWKREP